MGLETDDLSPVKPKLVALVAVILVALAVFLSTRPSKVAEEPRPDASEKLERTTRSGPGLSQVSASPERTAALKRWDLQKPRVSPHSAGSDEHLDWIEEQRADLLDKSWYFDVPEILNEVMANLRSSEPELREAALEAVINLSSRDAIPYLEEAAILAESQEEQRALIEAAEYLKLPTILEGRAQREKEAAAAKEAAAEP